MERRKREDTRIVDQSVVDHSSSYTSRASSNEAPHRTSSAQTNIRTTQRITSVADMQNNSSVKGGRTLVSSSTSRVRQPVSLEKRY